MLVGMAIPVRQSVTRLAAERPDWLPVLAAACVVAQRAEQFGGEFAGSQVLDELGRQGSHASWRPGLRLLVAYGLLEKSGESARGGRRAYYRMPDREEVEQALAMQGAASLRMTREQLQGLVEVAGRLRDEADLCAEGSCWHAALVLLGSSVEAGIVATACVFQDELEQQGLWPKGGWRQLATRDLGKVVQLAKDAGWLPARGEDAGRSPGGDIFSSLEGGPDFAGDAVGFLRQVRNMAVHPARWVSEDIAPRFDDDSHMRPTYEICQGIADAVFGKLHEKMDALPSR
jgi:hypothetical protein